MLDKISEFSSGFLFSPGWYLGAFSRVCFKGFGKEANTSKPCSILPNFTVPLLGLLLYPVISLQHRRSAFPSEGLAAL